jgi:hypothetical protein
MESIKCIGLTFRRYFGQRVNINRYFHRPVLCQSTAESTTLCYMESTALKGTADVERYCSNGQKYEVMVESLLWKRYMPK